MTSIQILSLIFLAITFVAATLWKINLGILTLVAAFLITSIAGLPVDTISEGFPASVVLLLVGVTFFFTVVNASHTMDYVMEGLLRLIGGRVAMVPFIFFALATFAVAIGTYSAAVAALLLPIAMRFARDYSVSSLLMGLMVIHGVIAGVFSPIAIDGIFTDGVLTEAGVPSFPMQLFLSHLAVHGIVCVAAFCLFGGLKLIRAPRQIGPTTAADSDTNGDGSGGPRPRGSGTTMTLSTEKAVLGRPTLYQACTMTSLVVLVVSAAGFGLDVGYVALTLGVVLALVFERKNDGLVQKMPWFAMMLVTGVLCYIAVLTEIGTLEAIGNLLAGFESPAQAVLALSFVSAITSAFASSLGVLGVNLPLAVDVYSSAGMSTLSVFGPVTIASTIVDASPMGIGGALVLANAMPEERPSLLRKLLLWGLSMIVIGPLLSWVIFTVF
jgi:Na+/H+ antiporter NhaC